SACSVDESPPAPWARVSGTPVSWSGRWAVTRARQRRPPYRHLPLRRPGRRVPRLGHPGVPGIASGHQPRPDGLGPRAEVVPLGPLEADGRRPAPARPRHSEQPQQPRPRRGRPPPPSLASPPTVAQPRPTGPGPRQPARLRVAPPVTLPA